MGCCSKRLFVFFSIHFHLFPKAKNDKSYVKIKDADGSVRRVEVTTGFTDGVYIEISEGLEEGEIVLKDSVVKD